MPAYSRKPLRGLRSLRVLASYKQATPPGFLLATFVGAKRIRKLASKPEGLSPSLTHVFTERTSFSAFQSLTVQTDQVAAHAERCSEQFFHNSRPLPGPQWPFLAQPLCAKRQRPATGTPFPSLSATAHHSFGQKTAAATVCDIAKPSAICSDDNP